MTVINKKLVIGISYSYHDSAVAILDSKNSNILYAAQEEIFSRIKHDPSFPFTALKNGLKSLNVFPESISAVGFFEDEDIKLRRKLYFKAKASESPLSPNDFILKTNNTIKNELIDALSSFYPGYEEIINEIPIYFSNHHYSHALSAAHLSGLNNALVLSIDAVGEMETLTAYSYEGSSLKLIESTSLPTSLGLYYSAITNFLGFQVNEGEYKVMGLSCYGKPLFLDKLRNIFDLSSDSHLQYFNFHKLETCDRLFSQDLAYYLGIKSAEDSSWAQRIEDSTNPLEKLDINETNYVHLASSLQHHYEEMLCKKVSQLLLNSNMTSLCLTGGCALNSLANQKLHERFPIPIYIQNSPGDAGSAIGAAINAHQKHFPNRKIDIQHQCLYLGPKYSNDEICQALALYENMLDITFYKSLDKLADTCSRHLRDKRVLGIFSAQHEWGPRALGNRSIVADPSFSDMKQIVNLKVKYREPYRPFAPIALEEYAKDYFDLRKNIITNDPYYAMIETCMVNQKGKVAYPAICHLDGTARIQLISSDSQIFMRRILLAHQNNYKSPVLLNTSFNLKGEPVVGTPLDAIRTFIMSGLDFMVIENWLIGRVK